MFSDDNSGPLTADRGIADSRQQAAHRGPLTGTRTSSPKAWVDQGDLAGDQDQSTAWNALLPVSDDLGRGCVKLDKKL